MDSTIQGLEERPVRVYTDHGIIDGIIVTGRTSRTLDDLNTRSLDSRSRTFLNLARVDSTVPGFERSDRPLAINKDAILFVMERQDEGASNTMAERAARLTRSAIQFRVEEYSIRGFIHVPQGGTAMPILNHEGRGFLAVTSATISGDGEEVHAPFLAVRRSKVRFAQELEPEIDASGAVA